LAAQLDYRTKPCNFVEIMPRWMNICGGRAKVLRA